MRSVFLVLFLAAGAQSAAAASLPADMLGAWASELSACGEQASELGMTIEPKTVLFYEHGFDIKKLTKLKDGSLKASGFSVADDGRAKGTLTLKQLSVDTLSVGEQTYHRCKGKRP
jgi:hypothetical protein